MSDSDSSDSDSSDEQQTAVQTKAPVQEESDSDSSDSSSEEETKKPAPVTKAKEADSSDDDSSSDEEEEPAKKPEATKAANDDDDDSSDSSSDEEEAPKKEVKATKAEQKKEEDSSDDDSSSDEEEEAPKKKESKPAEKAVSSDSSDSDDDSDDEKPKESKPAEKAEVPAKKEPEPKEPEIPEYVPKKEESYVLFEWDLKKTLTAPIASTPLRKRKLSAPSMPAAKKANSKPAGDVSVTIEKEFNPDDFRSSELKDTTNTIFVKGIDANAFEEDIKKFFTEKVAEPVSIRHKWEEGRPALAWVTFATNEQASKAVIDCNFEYIKDRYVNTDWAKPQRNAGGKGGRNSGPRNAHLKGTTNRIWIGNLHREVENESLVELFKEAGELTDCYIPFSDGSRPKIAFISVETNEIADKIVENYNGSELMGYNIRMDWAEQRRDGGNRKRKQELSEKPEGCVTCFVGRLSDGVDDDKLIELFKDAGELVGIRYMERDGEFKGVAFIQFAETECTDKAVQLNGTSFMGKNIRVDYAADRKKQREY